MSGSAHFRPRARADGIVAERIDDGLVVYDERATTAHYLSSAAASVWDLADGELSLEQIGAQLQLAPETVDRAVAELLQADLLEEPLAEHGYSRRQAAIKLAQAGGAAFAAPLIYSVAVPAAAFAASSCVGADVTTCTGSGAGKSGTSANCSCSGSNNTCYQNNNAGNRKTFCVPTGCTTQNSGTVVTSITKCCCWYYPPGTGGQDSKCTALPGNSKCPD